MVNGRFYTIDFSFDGALHRNCALRWTRKSGHWEAKIDYDEGVARKVYCDGGNGKGEVRIWIQDGVCGSGNGRLL
jgi:hypothetical protein